VLRNPDLAFVSVSGCTSNARNLSDARQPDGTGGLLSKTRAKPAVVDS
jgi:hypothetical protein